MISRYDMRRIIANSSDLYSDHFSIRDVKFINHFNTFEVKKREFEKTHTFNYFYHVWKMGDRLYKLADQHYGDPTLWWIIALFNNRPTESHFAIGETIFVPQPLNKVLEMFGV